MKRRLPKVRMAHGAFVGDRFQCSGPYSALHRNPFSHPQWPPFRVRFNHQWIDVQVVEYSEDWGWKAVSVEALQRDDDVTPRVEVRGRR
jgi:hypothetical protein